MQDKYKMIRKASFNINIISSTLLGGYIICDQSLLNIKGISLVASCVASGITFIKTRYTSQK